MSLYRELRRRRVFRSVAVYVVAAVAVLQAGDVLAKALHLPDGVLTLAAFMAIAGLRVVIALAWLFQLTRDGLRRQDVIDQADDALRAPPPTPRSRPGWGSASSSPSWRSAPTLAGPPPSAT